MSISQRPLRAFACSAYVRRKHRDRWHTRAYLYARATLVAAVASLIAAGGLMVLQEVGR